MRPCPSCGADRPQRTRYGRESWWVARCKECGFVYLPAAPEYEALQAEFEWSESQNRERKRRNARWFAPLSRALKRAQKRYFPKRHPMRYVKRYVTKGRLLDIGCGSGGRVTPYTDRFELNGIEISPKLAEKAQQAFDKSGGCVVCKSATEGLADFAPGSIDAAVLNSYLEHEREPAAVLTELSRVLRVGGVAVVKVPNFGSLMRIVMGNEWGGFRYPDHVNYFTLSSLREMARAAGLDVEVRLRDRTPTDDNIWAVLVKNGGGGAG